MMSRVRSAVLDKRCRGRQMRTISTIPIIIIITTARLMITTITIITVSTIMFTTIATIRQRTRPR